MALICCAFAFVNVAAVAPSIFGSHSQADTAGGHFRIAQINVNYRNENYNEVLQYIDEINPDFLMLEEYTGAWKRAVSAKLSSRFADKVEITREDPYGIAVFCRYPIANHRVFNLGGCPWPSIVSAVPFQQKTLTIFSTHTKGPIPKDSWLKQINQIDDLRMNFQGLHSYVLCGDLNMTPWSTKFRQLLTDAQLRDSRIGFGLQGSWPSARPILLSKLFKGPVRLDLFGVNAFISLPIDHCLVSKELSVVNRQVGPYVGSDHFPVVTDISASSVPE
ncbi:MAG: endonuclease/exonuclease/phosphatase family protein [Terriglobales bacterium]